LSGKGSKDGRRCYSRLKNCGGIHLVPRRGKRSQAPGAPAEGRQPPSQSSSELPVTGGRRSDPPTAHPIPIVRTPMACDLGVPPARNLTMGGEIHLTLGDRRRGKHPAGVPSRPVPVVYPSCRGGGVSSACPAAELHPGELIQAAEGGLTHPGAVIMGPTSDLGGGLADQGGLGPDPTAANDPPKLCQMRLGLCHSR
jgi:hypothetical protein